MTQNAFTLLTTFFKQIFRIFTSIIVPGTNFTFAELMFFIAIVPLAIAFIKRLLGMGGGLSDIPKTMRSNSNRKGE